MTDLVMKPAGADDLIEQVVIQGNLAGLTPAQRASYYSKVCDSLGLNPYTRPFEYITLNQRLVLYARKDATDQLRALRKVSLTITGRETVGDLYVVTARAALPDGRTDEEIGAVPIKGLAGEALANAYMKASTKAKRRVTLSICGLGMLDETETETISEARPFVEPLPAGQSPRMKALVQEMDAAVAEGATSVGNDQKAWEEEVAVWGAGDEKPSSTVPGDDVDELTGMELLEACQRMNRRLNAQGVAFGPIPTTRTNNALRQWWKLAAAALAAQR